MDESPSRLPKPMSSSQLPKKDGVRRRSMLLPPGTIAGAARRGVLSPTEEEPPRRRPITMLGDARSTAAIQRSIDEEQDDDDSRSPSPDSKERAIAGAHAALTGGSKMQSIATNGPKSGIARSTSVRASASGRAAAGRAQEQTQSRIASRPASMMVKDKPARPDSVASISSRTTTEIPTSRLRAPAPSANSASGLRRSATTTARHTRTQSALPSASTNTTLPRTDVRRHPTISEGTELRLHRAAFSTLQQHYSPKKNLALKPASSTLIHTQPVDTSSTLGLDTQLLQARLLQLSILHRQAEPTYQAWERSAKRKLKHKFTDVAAECEVVGQKEKEWRRRINTGALKEWCKGDMGLLAENVATLSNVISEVMQLVEDGGRVQQAVEIFEAWITWVEAIYQGRERQLNHSEFIEGLGDGWKNEITVLVRKLGSLARQLDALGKVEEGSSLHEMLSGFRALTRGAIDELRAVEKVESEVIKRERAWVDEQIGGLDGEVAALLA